MRRSKRNKIRYNNPKIYEHKSYIFQEDSDQFTPEIVQAEKQLKTFPDNKNLRLLIFSFLSGAEIYHKIAILNKTARISLPNDGLLDQVKVLTLYEMPNMLKYLKYAFLLSDVIELDLTEVSSNIISQIIDLLVLKNGLTKKQIQVDLRLTCTENAYNQFKAIGFDQALEVRKIQFQQPVEFPDQNEVFLFLQSFMNITKPKLWQLQSELNYTCTETLTFDGNHQLIFLEVVNLSGVDIPSESAILSQVKHPNLSKITLTAEAISMKVVEDILKDMHQSTQKSTRVTVMAKKVINIPLFAFFKCEKILCEQLQHLFQTQIFEAGKQLQIKFKHLSSKKEMNIYTDKIET